MMKLLVLVLVVGLAAWLFFGRSRKSGRGGPGSEGQPDPTQRQSGKNKGRASKPVQTMWVCAHCGVHLPKTEALTDPQGSAYCSDAHRLAGPRPS